jgi:hypothetical protein
MKKLITLVALVWSLTGFSQSFTLNELIKLSKYDDDEFDTYITKKGYVFNEGKADDFYITSDYTFLVDGYTKYFISKNKSKTKDIYSFISFQTPSSKTYLSIKEELKSNGFILLDKGVIDRSQYFEYKKGLNKVTITSISNIDEFSNKTSINYGIAIHNNYFK